MAKLYLKYEQSILGEYPLGTRTVTIGRRADNTIHIDHLSVSSNHARIDFEDGEYAIYDHESTNGTYVNGQQVTRRTVLQDGDTIHIARHILSFVEDETSDSEDESSSQKDGSKPPEVFGKMEEAQSAPAAPPAGPPEAITTMKLTGDQVSASAAQPAVALAGKAARVTVMSGKTDQKEYVLTGNLNVIGREEMATIRLMRWFAPKVAANIRLRDGKFFLSGAEGEEPVKVNGEVLKGERELAEGDVFEVDAVSMQFSFHH